MVNRLRIYQIIGLLVYTCSVSLKADARIETVFILDISSSMLIIYGNSGNTMLANSICYIEYEMENLPDTISDITLILFSQQVELKKWEKITPESRSDIKKTLSQLKDSTNNRWKKSNSLLSATYITKAIISAYQSMKYDAYQVKQNIYLFSDGELLLPKTERNPISYAAMHQELNTYKLSKDNLRNFYFFSMLMRPNKEIVKIVDKEGGNVFQEISSDYCNRSAKKINNQFIIHFKVLDQILQPFSKVQISSQRSTQKEYSDIKGSAYLKIESPPDIWFPFVFKHTGFDSSVTHAYLNSKIQNKDTITLISIMMTPIPIILNLSIFNDRKDHIKGCSLYIIGAKRVRSLFLTQSPEKILYYDYDHNFDTINLKFINTEYEPKEFPFIFENEKNVYELQIDLKKIKI